MLRFLLGSALAFTGMSASAATVKYSYTGSNYQSIQDSPNVAGSYSLAQQVTGYFTLSSALPGSLSGTVSGEGDLLGTLNSATGTDYGLLDFSFFDGRKTIDSTNFELLNGPSTMTIETDAGGLIVGWTIQLFGAAPEQPCPVAGNNIRTHYTSTDVRDEVTVSATSAGSCSNDSAWVYSAPGSWEVTINHDQTGVVPLPASLPLLSQRQCYIKLLP